MDHLVKNVEKNSFSDGLDGFKFRRQQGIENYVVDFCCPKVKLIVELDGSGHLSTKAKKKSYKRKKNF